MVTSNKNNKKFNSSSEKIKTIIRAILILHYKKYGTFAV
jgi:hypothetical protein